MKNSIWVWIASAAVLIIVVLGFWWWRGAGAGTLGYGPTANDTLQSANVPSGSVTPAVLSGSVSSILSKIPEASQFAGLLSQTGVAAELIGNGPYTLFVPTNGAFSRMPPGSLNLTAAALKRLVQYHVISGKAIDVNVQTSGTTQALSKDMLNFSVRQGDKSARVNSSVALQAFKASNGVVYLIDQVLIPPIKTQ